MNPEEIKRQKQQEGKRRNRMIIITILLLLFVLVIAGGVTPTLFNGFFNKAPLIPVSEVTKPIVPKVNTPKDEEILIPEETQVAAIDEAEPIITPEPAKIKPKFSPLKSKPPIINPTPSTPNIPGDIIIPNTPEIPDTPEIPNTPDIPDEPEPETPFIPWVRSIIGIDTFYAVGGWKIASVSDGSSIVTGWLVGTAIFGEGEVNETTLIAMGGGRDVVIAKYNTDGSLAWAKRAGGPEFSGAEGTGIASLSDGASIISGSFEDTAIFGEGELNETILTSAGDYDGFIAKYNADGSLAWARRAGGGSSWDWGYAITSFSDSSSIISGYFEDTAIFGEGEINETTLISMGGKDIFIAKYNADGSLAWTKRAGGLDEDQSLTIASLSDGSSIITGWIEGTAVFGEGEINETTLIHLGSADIFIAKYNADGSLAWAKRAGGINYENSEGIASFSDGSSIITGWLGGDAVFGEGEINETTLISVGGSEIFIAKYNADGSLAWAKKAGGPSVSSSSTSIASLPDGSSIVTGWFWGDPYIFGEGEINETILTNLGDDDGFIAKYNADGTLAWVRQIGGITWDDRSYPYGISIYPDGKISITGEYRGSIVFGSGDIYETTITNTKNYYDMFIAKYNAEGRLE